MTEPLCPGMDEYNLPFRIAYQPALNNPIRPSVTSLRKKFGVNKKVGKNFYDFVNQYRLEEFKRLLSDPKNRNLTLLSLAIDCGFNSKSSFNRHFKKVTGQTPSQYFAALKRDSVQSALEV